MLTLSVMVSDASAAAWLELGDSIFGALPWLVIVWLLLVFPSGSYPGRAERVTGSLIIGFAAIASAAFARGPCSDGGHGPAKPACHPFHGGGASVVAGDSGFLMVVASSWRPWCCWSRDGVGASEWRGSSIDGSSWARSPSFSSSRWATLGCYPRTATSTGCGSWPGVRFRPPSASPCSVIACTRSIDSSPGR